MSILGQVTQAASSPEAGFSLPEVGGAAGALTAGLYLIEKWMNYRQAGRVVASEETKEERSHIADWATRLLTADMEARKEDSADRRAFVTALAGLERQMALQTETLRQIQAEVAETKAALTQRRPMVIPLPGPSTGLVP